MNAVCRVCRSESDQPLKTPCLCTGSIKYVHQECLMEWLQHSNKTKCEVCGFEFQFDRVYSDQSQGVFFKIVGGYMLNVLRYVLAFLIWIVLLPLGVSFVLRWHYGYPLEQHVTMLMEGDLVLFALGLVVIVVLLLRDYFVSMVVTVEQQLQPGTVDDAYQQLTGRSLNEQPWQEEIPIAEEVPAQAQLQLQQAQLQQQQPQQRPPPQEVRDQAFPEDQDLGFNELLGLNGPIWNLLVNSFQFAMLIYLCLCVFMFIPYHLGIGLHNVIFGNKASFVEEGQMILMELVQIKIPAVATGYGIAFINAICLLVVPVGFVRGVCNITRMDLIFGDSESLVQMFVSLQKSLTRLLNFAYLSFKVLFVLAIELVAFPVCCGIMIDLSTLPLFFEGQYPVSGAFSQGLQTRLDFFYTQKLLNLLLHWFVGTLFMFEFAQFVSLVRGCFRPGVLWFIRDAKQMADDFNPVKDIVERPLLKQLGKIGQSLWVYSIVIGSIFGVTCYGVVLFETVLRVSWSVFLLIVSDPLYQLTNVPESIQDSLVLSSQAEKLLPLRWSLTKGFLPLPVDLLVIQLILPFAIKYMKPKKIYKKVWRQVLYHSATFFKLRSFLYGGLWPEDELTSSEQPYSENVFVDQDGNKFEFEYGKVKVDVVSDQPSHGFVRVVATDDLSKNRNLRIAFGIDMEPMPKQTMAAYYLKPQGQEQVQLIVRQIKKRSFYSTVIPFANWRDPLMIQTDLATFNRECPMRYVDESVELNESQRPLDYVLSLPSRKKRDLVKVQKVDITSIMPSSGKTSTRTTIIYKPKNFKARIQMFIGSMWLVAVCGFLLMFLMPIMIGRWLFSNVIATVLGALVHMVGFQLAWEEPQPIHDVYALSFGLLVMYLDTKYVLKPMVHLYSLYQKHCKLRMMSKQLLLTYTRTSAHARKQLWDEESDNEYKSELVEELHDYQKELHMHYQTYYIEQLKSRLGMISATLDAAITPEQKRNVNVDSLVNIISKIYLLQPRAPYLPNLIVMLLIWKLHVVGNRVDVAKALLNDFIAFYISAVKTCYIGLWVLLLPLLHGIVFDVAVVQPGKITPMVMSALLDIANAPQRLSPEFLQQTGGSVGFEALGVERAPVTFLLQDWVIGALYMRMAGYLYKLFNLWRGIMPRPRNAIPPAPPLPDIEIEHLILRRNMSFIQWYQWKMQLLIHYVTTFQFSKISMRDFHYILIPYIATCLSLALLPFCIRLFTVSLIMKHWPSLLSDCHPSTRSLIVASLQNFTYPIVFTVVLLVSVCVTVVDYASSLADKIQDEDYLIGKVLKDVDEEERRQRRPSSHTATPTSPRLNLELQRPVLPDFQENESEDELI